MKQCWGLTLTATTLAFFSVGASLMAQSKPTAEAGHGDVYGFGGIYHGAGLTAGSAGGGIAYTAARHLRVFGEGFYFRKDLSKETGIRNAQGSAFVFEGGAQILFPLSGSRAVPFATGGFGVARASGSVGRISATETVSHLVVGGGLDYYVGNNWGVRPEFRWYTGNETRATFGVFYRF